jgi:hypothetical protein
MFALLRMQVIAEFNGRLSFTCVEMRDCEHPPEGRCSPQGLLQQVLECAERYGVPLAGALLVLSIGFQKFGRPSPVGRVVRVELHFACIGRDGRLCLVWTAARRGYCSRCWSARSNSAYHWQVRYLF